MSATQIVFYCDDEAHSPVFAWLDELRRRSPRAFAKCVVRIRRLADLGHELRRPEADFLRDGIYELRIRDGRVNYRILYAFHGRGLAVLANSIVKEGRVPDGAIELALRRLAHFAAEPARHTFRGDISDA
jgi:phage-related protein